MKMSMKTVHWIQVVLASLSAAAIAAANVDPRFTAAAHALAAAAGSATTVLGLFSGSVQTPDGAK